MYKQYSTVERQFLFAIDAKLIHIKDTEVENLTRAVLPYGKVFLNSLIVIKL